MFSCWVSQKFWLNLGYKIPWLSFKNLYHLFVLCFDFRVHWDIKLEKWRCSTPFDRQTKTRNKWGGRNHMSPHISILFASDEAEWLYICFASSNVAHRPQQTFSKPSMTCQFCCTANLSSHHFTLFSNVLCNSGSVIQLNSSCVEIYDIFTKKTFLLAVRDRRKCLSTSNENFACIHSWSF